MKYVLITSAAIFVASTQPTHAYLDPGSGSYLLQLVIGGFLGSLFLFKSYGAAMKAAFKSKLKGKQDHDNDKSKTKTETNQ